MIRYRKRLDVSWRELSLRSPILLENGPHPLLIIFPDDAQKFHHDNWENKRWAVLMRELSPLLAFVEADPEAPRDRIEYWCDYDIIEEVYIFRAEEFLSRPKVRFVIFDENMASDSTADSVLGEYVYG